MMNKTIRVRRAVRFLQKPSLLMEFNDYPEFTRCAVCNETDKSYVYILALNDGHGAPYVCNKHKRKWDSWGMAQFKEMIHHE